MGRASPERVLFGRRVNRCRKMARPVPRGGEPARLQGLPSVFPEAGNGFPADARRQGRLAGPVQDCRSGLAGVFFRKLDGVFRGSASGRTRLPGMEGAGFHGAHSLDSSRAMSAFSGKSQ